MYNSKHHNSFSDALLHATGTIDYNMTNDYMFRAILQKNQKVLKGLVCALLHLYPNEIKSISIMNPIELGSAVDDKSFILDIKVLMNDNTILNLEMQVADQLNWSDRSLSYLCRSFDQLEKGEEYSEAKPAIHIGFLCFTPFMEHPEFYATYKLMNVKTHNVYSDKFILSVVDLTKIELATKEDKQYEIDYWASLFKAETWEELRMIAKNNEFMQEATETLFELNADELVRQQCLARQDFYRGQFAYQKRLAEQEIQITTLTSENESLSVENEFLSAKNESLSAENVSLSAENESLSAENVSLSAENVSLSAENESLSAAKNILSLQNSELLSQVKDKEQLIMDLQAQLNKYRTNT